MSGCSLPACLQTLAQLKCLEETIVARRKTSSNAVTVFTFPMIFFCLADTLK